MLIKSILVVLAILVLTTASVAQQKEPNAVYFDSSNQCFPQQQLKQQLEEVYGEQPFVIGMGVVKSPITDEIYQGLMMMYANPKKYTFTVIIYFEDDALGCILISGEQFQPAVQGPRT